MAKPQKRVRPSTIVKIVVVLIAYSFLHQLLPGAVTGPIDLVLFLVTLGGVAVWVYNNKHKFDGH